MKKGFLISLVAASLLSVAQAADYGRMQTGFSEMADIQDHAQEARSSAMGQASSVHSTAMGQASSAHSAMGMNNDSDDDSDMDYDEDAMKHAQEARSSAMGQASSAHSTAMGEASSAHSAMGMNNDSDDDSDSDMDYDEDAVKHAQEARSSAMGQASSAHSAMGMNNDSDDDSDSDMDYDEDAVKHAQEARSSAMGQASSAHSTAMGQASSAHSTAMEHAQENHRNRLLEMVETGEIPDTLPPESKEVLEEVKKAVKFAKHPELFADLNITDLTALEDPQVMQEIQERVQEAFKKRSQEVAHKLIDNQPKRELPVAGDFVKIGEGQYDWAFVTTSGHVYKLVGVGEDGKFKYQPLSGVIGEIAPDGTVTFDGQNPSVALPQEPLPGYPFAKYDDPNENGFDWIVVTKSGHIYKLEGFDKDSQGFFYTPVDGLTANQQGDEVVILPENLPGS